MGKKLRVCVVGGGRIGTIHMDAVQKNQRMKLTYFVDVDNNRRQQIAEEVEGVETFTSIHDILDNEEKRLNMDAVIVCSPTATHMDVVMSCLKHKIPVMCEKPLSMNVTEIAEAYKYADETNVPLLCGYQRRHDPSFSALETAIRNGEIGDLRSIRSCSRDNPIPSVNFLKISGGIMHDCASHDIDVLRWLTREDPVEVYAVASAFNSDIKDLDDWDTVLICLKFPSGVIANIDICRHAPYGYDQRIEALGSKGMLQAENRRATSLIRSMENSISIDPNFYSFPQRYRETYALELDHFAAIILDGVTPKVSGEDCVKVAIIADMAHESCKLGRPIKIDYTLR